MRPYRLQLIGAVVLMALSSAALLGSPWLAKLLTQAIVSPTESSLSKVQIISVWVVLLLIQAVLGFTSSLLMSTTGQRILHDLRNKIFSHVQRLPLTYQSTTKRGDTLSLFTNDAGAVSQFISNTAVAALPQVMVCLGAIVMLTHTHLPFGISAIVAAVGFVLAMKIYGRRIRGLSSILVTQHAQVVASLEQNLQQLPLVKNFNAEAKELKKFSVLNSSFFDTFCRYLKHSQAIMPAVNLVGACLVLVFVALLLSQLENNQLSVPDLVSILLYGFLLTRPISALAASYGLLQSTLAASQRLQTVFSVPEEAEYDSLKQLKVQNGDVEFSSVSFSYPDGQPILNNASFTIPGKSSSAVVGLNGAGKSTVAKLLMRFLEPDSGDILIDGQSTLTIPPPNVRELCVYVNQRPVLVQGTIFENLRYAADDITDNDVVDLLSRTRNLEWVKALPQGFNTPVGEQGMKLSGGQAQRVSLCQALLAKPEVLILDEPTSMQDATSVNWFEGYAEELANRTVIVITHDDRIAALLDHEFHMSNSTLTQVR